MTELKLKEACDALLADIERMLGGPLRDGLGRSELQLRLEESWQVGRLILETEQRCGFSERERGTLLRLLSTALNRIDAKRFGRRNVFYMRKYAREYPAPAADEQLSWSHFRVLLSVKDAQRRSQLAARAVEEGLSVRAFENVVLDTVGLGTATRSELDRVMKVASRRVGVGKVVESADGTRLLDSGFGVWVRAKGLEKLQAGVIVQKDPTTDAYVVVPGGKGYRYAFWAYVNRVVDGDTLLLEVVLGEHTRVRQRLRLRGVNAMEAGTALGDQATRFVQRRLKSGKQVLVHTYGNDMYGRYVADVFYCREGNCHWPEQGIFLNREMVTRKVARLRGQGDSGFDMG